MVKCAKCGITFPNVKEWFLYTCNSIIHNHCTINLTVDDLTSGTSRYQCLYCEKELDGFGGFTNHVCPNKPTLKYGNQ